MPKHAITPELQAMWFQLMNENQTVRKVLAIVAEKTPEAFTPGKSMTPDSVAMTAAHAQGWKDCLSCLEDIAMKRVESVDSGYMDMTDEKPENKG